MKRNKWLSRLDSNQCNDGVKVRCLTAWLLDNISCPSVRAVKRPTALSACMYSLHAVTGLFPVVRKEITMKTLTVIGSTTNPIP